ncbi:RidA family protein [Listeria sp. PSOL-1]|uniref:RidA family protein n=1 Tax=Listeria sp. PSOL-1 TaxID=1844999 RepID=UPI0013D03638|nr:RidA family protein [Listeria sp. PSOL-1]
MNKKTIISKKAPAAIGPYSHAVLAGETLYVSGQLGLDPTSGELLATLNKQVEQAMANLNVILKEAGMDFTNVVKTTVFLVDMKDFPTVNELYGHYFSENSPARSCFQVAKLPKDGLFEIEVVAVK